MTAVFSERYPVTDRPSPRRINYYVVLTVTDAAGNSGKDVLFLTQNNFPATNAPPVPVIAVSREYRTSI